MTTSGKTLGLIGSGNIGGTVARLAVDAGYDVVLSNSRDPHTLDDLVADLGTQARAATPSEAAAAGDLVVVTVPLKALPNIPAEPLAGKVVLDTGNYYPSRDGQIAGLDDGSTTSSELLQAHLPTSHVVKVFNNIYFGHLAALPRPSAAADRSALAIAGDSADAKATATEFLDAIGYDTVDVGALAEGWRYQPDTPAYGSIYGDNADFSVAKPKPTDAATVRDAVAAAQR